MKFKAVRERSSLKEGRNRKIRKRNIKFGRKKKRKSEVDRVQKGERMEAVTEEGSGRTDL